MNKLITGVDLKDTTMIDAKLLIDIPATSSYEKNNEVILQVRNISDSPFKSHSFVLSDKYNWELGIDIDGKTILVPTTRI